MGYHVVLQEPDGRYVGIIHVTLSPVLAPSDRMVAAARLGEERYKEGKGVILEPGVKIGRAIVVYEAESDGSVVVAMLKKMAPKAVSKVWTEVGGSVGPAVGA